MSGVNLGTEKYTNCLLDSPFVTFTILMLIKENLEMSFLLSLPLLRIAFGMLSFVILFG